jgi:signal transduction histidine kinase
VTDIVFACTLWIAPWVLGRLARDPSRRADAFRDLAEQTAAEVEARRRAAVAEEQARIGQELQDIIAHSVSAMIVQAGGARQLLYADPGSAREAILSVESAGRDALGDLRRLLGVLRRDDDPYALAPQPGIAELPLLVEALRRSGLDCRLVQADRPHLTPGVDLVAYRVVETALEAARDGGCRTAAVTIEASADRLELDVRGDAAVPGLNDRLAGVANRAVLYDGRVDVVANDGAGFRIEAALPIARLAAV